MSSGSHDLTPREREVLELIRVGLTNEEIARGLGITLDGAKYHVSQILSKLGVATREEAAAVAVGERRRWWARWPLWAKVAGAATVAAAAAGVAVLASSTADEEPVDDDLIGLTVEEAFARMRDGATRPGHLLHSTITADRTLAEGDGHFYTLELWLDMERDAARTRWRFDPAQISDDMDEESESIIVGRYTYNPSEQGEARRDEVPSEYRCAGGDAVLGIFVECFQGFFTGFQGDLANISIGSDDRYKGRPAFVLVAEGRREVPIGDNGRPAPSGSSRTAESRTTSRLYVATDTFLPMARVTVVEFDGEEVGRFTSEYEHEFLRSDEVPADLLDPVSFSQPRYTLDQVERTFPVYWIGEHAEFDSSVCTSPSGDCDLILGNAVGPNFYYRGASGGGATIVLYSPENWRRFTESPVGRRLYDPACTEQYDVTLGERTARAYAVPLRVDAESACADLFSDPISPEGGGVMGVADFGDVVAQVSGYPTSYFDSPGAMEALLKALERREPPDILTPPPTR